MPEVEVGHVRLVWMGWVGCGGPWGGPCPPSPPPHHPQQPHLPPDLMALASSEGSDGHLGRAWGFNESCVCLGRGKLGVSWLCEALGWAFTSTLRYHQERTYVHTHVHLPAYCVWRDVQERWATQGLGGVAFVSDLGLVAINLEQFQK